MRISKRAVLGGRTEFMRIPDHVVSLTPPLLPGFFTTLTAF